MLFKFWPLIITCVTMWPMSKAMAIRSLAIEVRSSSFNLQLLQKKALTRIDHTGILWLSPGTLFLPADCWICWVRWILSTSDDYPDVKLDTSRLGQTFSDHN